MNDLLRRGVAIFGRTRKEIRVHGSYAEHLWAVEADASQIEHVFLNLYINAWQAMPEGGDLFLATENVVLDEQYLKPYGKVAPGRFVKIAVRDTGVGMDEATKERVFEPFFTTKERGRGTGLGMASAYGIVKSHGGVISVDSEVGAGTTITIYLPASDKPKQAAPGPLRRRLRRGNEVILIIDDEEMVADVTREMLERIGHRVLVANSGRDGIALFRQQKEEIALVVLDMIMPGMTGRETFAMLKTLKPDVRVLLCSGYSFNGQARGILEQGCQGFIQKPFDIEKLCEKIGEILRQPARGGTAAGVTVPKRGRAAAGSAAGEGASGSLRPFPSRTPHPSRIHRRSDDGR
jgi:CheY-like chemotaxis protein